jgi:hypothetical protein
MFFVCFFLKKFKDDNLIWQTFGNPRVRVASLLCVSKKLCSTKKKKAEAVRRVHTHQSTGAVWVTSLHAPSPRGSSPSSPPMSVAIAVAV